MAFEFAEVPFALSDLVVAQWVSTTSYGIPASIAGGQRMEVAVTSDTDQLREYSAIVEGLAVVVGGEVTLKQGGIDFSALATITNNATRTSATTPNRLREMDVVAGGAGLNYFGVLGRVPTTDGGATIVGLPKVKLNSFPSWTLDGETNKFFIAETEGMFFAVTNAGVTKVMRIRSYETASDFVTPASGGAFSNFFWVDAA